MTDDFRDAVARLLTIVERIRRDRPRGEERAHLDALSMTAREVEHIMREARS
jgi:hypothetical protein